MAQDGMKRVAMRQSNKEEHVMYRHWKKVGKPVARIAVWAIFLSCSPLAWAQDGGPSAFPEGSASIIQTRTWQIAGSDPPALLEQTKAAVGEIGKAVLVKEAEGLLIVSLPTEKLAELRQALDKFGTMLTTAEEEAPGAPTTLLRMTFTQPSAAS